MARIRGSPAELETEKAELEKEKAELEKEREKDDAELKKKAEDSTETIHVRNSSVLILGTFGS